MACFGKSEHLFCFFVFYQANYNMQVFMICNFHLFCNLFDAIFVVAYVQHQQWVAVNNIPAAMETRYLFCVPQSFLISFSFIFQPCCCNF